MRVRATEQGEGGTLFVLRFAEEIDTERSEQEEQYVSLYRIQRTQPSDMEDVEERAISGLTIRIEALMQV